MNPLSGHHLAVYHDIRKVHLIFMTVVAFIHSFISINAPAREFIWVVVNQSEEEENITR